MRDPMLAYVKDKIVEIKIILLAIKITATAVVSLNVDKVKFLTRNDKLSQ